MKSRTGRIILLALFTPALALAAARKDRSSPLDRVQPVPAGEEIPIIDFFRPALLEPLVPELLPASPPPLSSPDSSSPQAAIASTADTQDPSIQ
jgi:hypothetical protein